MNEIELPLVWQAYFDSKATGSPDPLIEKRLVEHYYPLVKKVANRLHQKIADVQPDELASMGVDGLYDSVRAYDTAHKTKFETYATPRIRGSMLDAIRKADWVPRLVRAKAAKLDRCRAVLESSEGRKLADSEMAKKLSMSNEEYDEFAKGAATPAMHFVSEMSPDGESEKQLSIEHIEDSDSAQPIDNLLRNELFWKLMGKNFTPQERTIIKLYYYNDLSMKEISDKVNLSESRVSQMHTIILKRLRQKAERNPAYFADVFAMTEKFRETAHA
jgi:RNA polymerase sigma factor for flagellar operon FliA